MWRASAALPACSDRAQAMQVVSVQSSIYARFAQLSQATANATAVPINFTLLSPVSCTRTGRAGLKCQILVRLRDEAAPCAWSVGGGAGFFFPYTFPSTCKPSPLAPPPCPHAQLSYSPQRRAMFMDPLPPAPGRGYDSIVVTPRCAEHHKPLKPCVATRQTPPAPEVTVD